jgi:hypothetical protein
MSEIPGETWVPIEGFPQYEISDHGRVRNVSMNRGFIHEVKPSVSKRYGRYMVWLCDGARRTANWRYIFVAKAFCPRPHLRSEVKHKYGHKTNDRASNLEWVTRAENVKHYIHGLGNDCHGSNGPNAKLTFSEVAEIRDRYERGEKGRELAHEFGVSHATISRIVNYRTHLIEPAQAQVAHAPGMARQLGVVHSRLGRGLPAALAELSPSASESQ